MTQLLTYDAVAQKIRPAKDVSFADRILELKKANKFWESIEMILEAWATKNPDEFRGFKVQVGEHRRNLTDKKYAETNDGKDYNRRMIMVMPFDVQRMIRAIYSPEELVMDQAFFREFATRFPTFRIPEKI